MSIPKEDITQSKVKNIILPDKNQEQNNSDMPISPQKTEAMVRNKVLWQKNMLPRGGVDWVIVGFSAPISFERKVEAEIHVNKDFEDKKASANVVTTIIPRYYEDTVEKDVMGLIVEEDSKILAAEAFKIQEAAITKCVTNEIDVLKKKAKFEYDVVEMSSGNLSESYLGSGEAMTESANGAKKRLLTHSRNRSVNNSSLTAAEILQYPKDSSQSISATHSSSSITSKMESGGLGLSKNNVQWAKAKLPRVTRIKPCSNHQPCITLPVSSPPEKQHPAEILKSWSSSSTNTSNDYTRNAKTRLATSVSSMTKRSTITRPKTSASVASRIIKRDLGL